MSENLINNPNDQFIALLMKHQKRIYGFIRMLAPCKSHADDLMQDTAIVMWQKFGQFEPDSDFVAWGIKIAQFKVLNFRRKQKKESLTLTDQALEAILARHTTAYNDIDERVEALAKCVSKLKTSDRQLVHMRYALDLKAASIAERLDRTADGIYHSFSRIHHTLQLCIIKTITAMGGDQ